MTSTGKHARKKWGTRAAAKRSKRRSRKNRNRVFGSLTYSTVAKTAESLVRKSQTYYPGWLQ
jgi:hypothetical protein